MVPIAVSCKILARRMKTGYQHVLAEAATKDGDAVRPKFTFVFPGYIVWFSYSVNFLQLYNQSGIILSVFNEKEGNVEGLRFLFAISI
jgi:hypothetical protein